MHGYLCPSVQNISQIKALFDSGIFEKFFEDFQREFLQDFCGWAILSSRGFSPYTCYGNGGKRQILLRLQDLSQSEQPNIINIVNYV
jgi:hypothetical protein